MIVRSFRSIFHLSALLLTLFLSASASAQIFELAYPSGQFPLKSLQTINPITGNYRAPGCVDGSGTLNINSSALGFPLLAPDGTPTAPSYAFSANAGTGWRRSGTGIIAMTFAGADVYLLDANNQKITLIGSTPAICWNVIDVCFTSNGAGIMRLGTTVTNNNATLELKKLNFPNSSCIASGTAANPSVVTCGANATGLVYCDVAASAGTCVINSSLVTTSSTISITFNAADGVSLGKTCNTALTFGNVPTLAAKNNGVSFTINLPTMATNGTCVEYSIWN